MLRRLAAFLLLLACALAPALELSALATTPAKPADCCCHRKCPCDMPARAPAPCAPTAAAQPATAAVGRRVTAARPKLRVAFLAFARLLFVSESSSVPAVRRSFAAVPAPADSVALYEAHCSRLI